MRASLAKARRIHRIIVRRTSRASLAIASLRSADEKYAVLTLLNPGYLQKKTFVGVCDDVMTPCPVTLHFYTD